MKFDKKKYQKKSESTSKLHIDVESYNKLMHSLDDGKEYGGSFKKNGKKLHIDYLTGGGKSSIVLPTFPYEHHTHPSKCLSKDNCALGMPSVPDMVNILGRCTEGNQCHFVFAHEGVFVVGIKDKYKKLYKQNKSIHSIDKKKINRQLENLYDRFSESERMSYERFSKIWLKEVNSEDSPFKVDFFAVGDCACVPDL